MPLDFNEIRQLLTTIAQTDITEVTLKSDDFEITVRKAVSTPPGMGELAGVGTTSGLTSLPPAAPVSPSPTLETTTRPEAAGNGGVQPPATPSSREQKKYLEVTSPMVGTFYRASAPGESPFVEVGDRIKSGQTVCIIEAMKLMNEIEAEISGQVIEILVQNGEPVEYGQSLMRINPD